MRIGVIGCGYWGSKHVRVLQQTTDVDYVAVIDPREDRRTALLRSFPALGSFAAFEAAARHVDAVVIATPPSSHVDLALQALRAGKHVLIEKPMATSVVGARQVTHEAEAAGLTLMVGHTFEYNAAVWRLREAITSGELGSLYYIDTARLNLGLYQTDVNVIWDLAPHDLSIVNYLLGRPPDMVQAWASSYAHAYLKDVAYLRLQYRDMGTTAQIHVSWLDPCKVRRVTAVGSQKMAVYNDLADDERIRIYDKGVVAAEGDLEPYEMPMSYRYGGITSPYIALQEPLNVQDRHFVECIQSCKQPLTNGENGLRVVQMLEAADLSVKTERQVALESLTTISG